MQSKQEQVLKNLSKNCKLQLILFLMKYNLGVFNATSDSLVYQNKRFTSDLF